MTGLNIIQRMQVTAAFHVAFGLVLLSGSIVASAQMTEPPARDETPVETLFDDANPAGRRMSPTREQVDWRVAAGEHDSDAWPTELLLRQMEPLFDRFFGAIQGRRFSPELTAHVFTDSFRGDAIATGKSGGREDAVGRSSLLASSPALDATAFAAAWSTRFSNFDVVVRTEHYIDAARFEADDTLATLLVPFRVTGVCGDARCEDQGIARFVAAKSAGGWKFESIDVLQLDALRSPTIFETQVLVGAREPVDVALNAFVDYFAEGVTVVDIDDDDDLDVIGARRFTHPVVLINEGDRKFVERSADLGFGNIRSARSTYFFDWDNDGDKDALVLTATGMRLLRQDAVGFIDVSEDSGFDRMRTTGLTGATVADFDNDGLLDFYVANYGGLQNLPVMDYFDSRSGYKNQMFRNMGSGDFEMVTVPAGLDRDNARWSFAAISFDYDEDGWQDLYVVNDYGPNQLFRNRGDLTFEDVTGSTGVSDPGNGMGVSLGDVDGDGREDLYVSNMISHAGKRIAGSTDFKGKSDDQHRLRRFAKGNTLLIAREDGFSEIETPVLSDAKWAWGNALFDYDNDADLDVYVTNGMYSNLSKRDTDPVFWRHLLAPISKGVEPAPFASGNFAFLIQQESFSFAGYERNRLFRNHGDGSFHDVAAVVGADLVLDSRSVVPADMDNDGDLDLVVASRNDPKLVVLWNELGEAGDYIDVALKGSASNRDGVGAVLELSCNGKTQRRTQLAGSGYLSQGPLSVWFGLGACERLERLTVRWPSGTTSELADVDVNQRIVVRED